MTACQTVTRLRALVYTQAGARSHREVLKHEADIVAARHLQRVNSSQLEAASQAVGRKIPPIPELQILTSVSVSSSFHSRAKKQRNRFRPREELLQSHDRL